MRCTICELKNVALWKKIHTRNLKKKVLVTINELSQNIYVVMSHKHCSFSAKLLPDKSFLKIDLIPSGEIDLSISQVKMLLVKLLLIKMLLVKVLLIKRTCYATKFH